MLSYHHQLEADGSHTVVETSIDGQRPVDPQQADYLHWLAAGNIPTVQPYVPLAGPTLEEVKAAKAAEIVLGANAFLAQMGQEYGEMERTTWPTQSVEAKALVAAEDAPAPLVRMMAAQRGMDAVDLAHRIIANEAQWIGIAGYVIGQRQAYQDRLDAAVADDDIEAVQAITVIFSLPGLT